MLIKTFKKEIHKLTRTLGFDFYALKDRSEGEQRRLRWLKNMNIKSIFDIGANTGQFASIIRKMDNDVSIYSFEPITDCYQKLNNIFKDDKKFFSFNLACGNYNQEIEMNVNNFSESSSILEMDELHVKNFEFTSKSKKQTIKVVKLDDFVRNLSVEKPYIIKIDTQGFEKYVIEGGKDFITNADVILIELSYKKLYKNQALFHELYVDLVTMGFEYNGNLDNLYSTIDGSVLQSDGIFIKKK